MRKFTSIFAVFLAVLSICLVASSCAYGGQMKGWPTFDLNLDIESYDEVSIEYHHAVWEPSDRRPLDEEIEFYGTSSDKEVISDVYLCINGLPYSKKTYKKIDTEKYVDKVVVQFYREGEAAYVFKFYAYGVTDGYFIFDNGEIHAYRGDFAGLTYRGFQDRLS